ncbi:HIRAN domain-containing protein [Mesorhizobium sp. SB112]|uniref:HIRAN domain-containing protein n=1 Tax=Mesorhizobium sp. SB112 TaxID=3151853 RepID=UPI00326554F5
MGILSWLFRTRPRQLVSGRFGTDRHQPFGQWVQATHLVQVAGINHRRTNVLAFFDAVQAAERSNGHYGIKFRPDPNNAHDRYAIAVDGVVGNRRWHIGYLDRQTAKAVHDDLLSNGIPIAGEIYNLWASGDDYLEVKIFVLAPPGNRVKGRLKRASREEKTG